MKRPQKEPPLSEEPHKRIEPMTDEEAGAWTEAQTHTGPAAAPRRRQQGPLAWLDRLKGLTKKN
jgi:hypothetical protein